MTTNEKHILATEQIWRVLRALFFIAATFIWLEPETTRHWIVFGLVVGGFTMEQMKGFIENRIEDLLGWARDFTDWG